MPGSTAGFSARSGLVLLSLIAVSSSHSLATCFVAVRADDEVVLAIDSRVTIRHSDGRRESEAACKLARVGGHVFASGGLSELIVEGRLLYRESSTLGQLEKRELTLEETLDSIKAQFVKDLERALRRAEESGASERIGPVKVVVVGLSEGVPALGMLEFRMIQEEHRPWSVKTATRYVCPGDCPDGTVTAWSCPGNSVEQVLGKAPELVEAGPVQGVRRLIEEVAGMKPKSVAPPVSVLVVSQSGFSWASEDHLCGDDLVRN